MRSFGTINKTKKGRYQAVWTENGRRPSKTFDTKKEAAEYLAHKEVEKNGAGYFCTYSQYWDTEVLPSFEFLQPNTIHGYMQAWAALEPKIGMRSIDSTTYREAERILRSVGAPSLQKKCYVLWKKICNMAVRDRIISSNPIDRSIRLKKVQSREKVLYDRTDIPHVMDAVAGCKYEPLFLLEVGGGLRHEEAMAICGCDIEKRRSGKTVYASVSVNKALVCVDGNKYLKDTKNAFSKRMVVIGEPFASRLLEIADGTNGPLMFGNIRGDGTMPEHYASPNTASHNWKDWCTVHNVKHVLYGNMRSTYATLLGEAGALDSLVSMAMGHSGQTTKSAHYQQQTLKGLEIVADCYTDYLSFF